MRFLRELFVRYVAIRRTIIVGGRLWFAWDEIGSHVQATQRKENERSELAALRVGNLTKSLQMYDENVRH